MRPVAVVLALLVVAVPAPAAAAKRATVALTECTPALAQPDRVAVFEGRMRATRLGQRLQMRFALQTRAPGQSRWSRVAAPGWEEWTTADPGVGRYRYEKRVENLAAPAVYRAAARFRWTDALGRVVGVQRARSASCRQPDLRPDLQPERPQRSGDRYLVPVHNAGRTAAGAFEVVLTVNGRAQPPQSVFGLAAGARTVVAVAAPACEPGSVVTAAVDPQARVDERDELDNSASLACSEANR